MKGHSIVAGMRILLVEDDEHDRVAFRRALGKDSMSSCRIAECCRAEDALQLAGDDLQSFDLVVIDFSLPGMSGMELFHRLHDEEESPPFVMLTGRGSELLAVGALKAGFADYIVKDPEQSYLQLLPVVLSEVVCRHREQAARKSAEKAVAASQKRLAQTLESITDAYFALDEQWRIVELNAAAEREVFARPAPELLGTVIWDLHPLARRTEFYQQYHWARDHGEPVHFEGKSTFRDKWWEAHAYPRGDHLEIYLREITERKRFEARLREANEQLEARVAGRTRQLTAAVRALEAQIGERNKVEQALRVSREQYSNLVQNSLTAIFIEQQGRIVFANQKSAEIYGYEKEEFIGMKTLDLIYPADRALIAEITEKRLKGLAVPTEYDARGITKSGETIWIQRRNALMDYQGKPAILVNHIDITKTRQAFEALAKNQRQLKFLSSRLLSAQEDERKRVARELHDSIGSSLSAVKYRLDNLLQSLEPSSDAAQSVATLQGVVQETMEEARRLMSDLRPAMLDDLGLISTIGWFCRRFQTLYPHIRVERRVEIGEDEIPEPLKIVMFRLIQEACNNIAKYSEADSATIALVETGNVLELTITDDGKGFEPESVLTMDYSGSGLGLTSMRERTELSGGSFVLESSLGKGTKLQARWTRPIP